MNSARFDAVLLIGLGGPTSENEVRSFIEKVLEGRAIPEERLKMVLNHYQMIGGKSPYNKLTQAQAGALDAYLRSKGVDIPILIGFRYSSPSLQEVMGEIKNKGFRRILGVVLTTHRSPISFDRYVASVDEARQQVGLDTIEFDYLPSWHLHPLFIETIASRIQDVLLKLQWTSKVSLKTEIVFTVHSLPLDVAKKCTYEQDTRDSAVAVMKHIGRFLWDTAYQSRSGYPEEPWLKPDINDWIRNHSEKGIQNILIVPIGFLCDHVEVLADLDVTARKTAEKSGVSYARALTVMDHPKFIEMLGTMIDDKLSFEA